MSRISHARVVAVLAALCASIVVVAVPRADQALAASPPPGCTTTVVISGSLQQIIRYRAVATGCIPGRSKRVCAELAVYPERRRVAGPHCSAWFTGTGGRTATFDYPCVPGVRYISLSFTQTRDGHTWDANDAGPVVCTPGS